MTNKFFDIYSSPIVRNFFAKYVASKCSINWAHSPSRTTTINSLTTTLEINYSNSFRSYSTVVNSNVVTVTLHGDIGEQCDIDYAVNYSFTRTDLPRITKLKITKWLLAVWKLENTNYSAFVACPAGNLDNNGTQWRTNTYTKLGFKPVDSKSMKYINK
jgi:hypothetical protein